MEEEYHRILLNALRFTGFIAMPHMPEPRGEPKRVGIVCDRGIGHFRSFHLESQLTVAVVELFDENIAGVGDANGTNHLATLTNDP
jgi:hypothetical protein